MDSILNEEKQTEIYRSAIEMADAVMIDLKQIAKSKDIFSEIHNNFNIDLDTGISRDILFLIQTYEHTNEKKYVDFLCILTDQLIVYCDNVVDKNFGLYKGRMGIVYTLIQVFKTTNTITYLNKALEIAKGSNAEFLTSTEVSNGLSDGRSGALLALLHLYDEAKEEWILTYIQQYAEKIIKETCITSEGIYWDYSNQTIKGLCGFAEGTAGISFVFRELASYFKNDAFQIVSNWANDYEKAQWNVEHKNWPNYKKGVASKGDLHYYLNAYEKENLHVFAPYYNDLSWAHGASGILLGSKRMSSQHQMDMIAKVKENLNEEKVSDTKQVKNIQEDNHFGKILALSLIGNHNKEKHYIEKAHSLLLDHDNFINKELLHNDKSGYGMLCFQLINDGVKSSIFLPFVTNSSATNQFIDLDAKKIKSMLLGRSFSKSIHYLSQTNLNELSTFFQTGKDLSSFLKLLDVKYKELDALEDISLKTEVILEKSQFEMFRPQRNNTLLWIKKIVTQQRFSEQYTNDEEMILNTELILDNENFNIVKTSNTKKIDITDHKEHELETFINYGKDSFLLRLIDTGQVHRTPLQIVQLIYDSFDKESTINNVVEKLLHFFSHQNIQIVYGVRKNIFMDDHEDFKSGFKKAFIRITIDMIYNGILKPVNGSLWKQ